VNKTNLWRTCLVVVALVAVTQTMSAHFKLVEPASWLIENDRGDPQKSGPCGGSNTDWGKPSYVVSKAVGGSKLHIKVQETVYHPGHYRVALAVNSPNELPADPQATTKDGERGPLSVSAAIQNPELRKASESRREAMMAAHDSLTRSMTEGRGMLVSLMGDLQDLRNFIGSDLTESAVASAQELFTSTQANAKRAETAVAGVQKQLGAILSRK